MEPDEERALALALLRRYGWNATSFQILEPGFSYWFDEGGDACVAYVDTGAAWVAAGAPIASDEALPRVVERFLALAAKAGRRVTFFAVEDRFRRAVELHTMQVGEQPVWDPRGWTEMLKGARRVREQLRRARNKGVTTRLVAAEEILDVEGATRRGLDTLIARWLGSRPMAPMGFLVLLHPFAFAEERRYFVAEWQGRIVGFLVAVPVYARRGWFLEDFLRDPRAPNGTAELLVDHAMRWTAEDGAPYVTLGLAPLAGNVRGWLRAVRNASRALYDFSGLYSFKAKLRPDAWEPLFLACPTNERGFVAVGDTLVAFARGKILSFGVETLLRVPTIVVQVLAGLLVPWTLLLACASGARYFPAPWVRWAWAAFDVLVFVGLFALAKRWRTWLAKAMAALVTLDALVTAVEALLYNVPRAASWIDAVVIGVGVGAPTVAAYLLHRARANRATWQDEL